MLKKILFWTLAVLITVGASVYQRRTGPTHPQKVKVEINGVNYDFMLSRSGSSVSGCKVELAGLNDVNLCGCFAANLHWRNYKSDSLYHSIPMASTQTGFMAVIPPQSKAAKAEYYITLDNSKVHYLTDGQTARIVLLKNTPVVTRFKGDVPAWLLIPHILFMFASMLFACYAALTALSNMPSFRRYIKLALWTLVLGGFIFGPVIQYYAFNIWWSGFPFGMDLTDNKTLLALIVVLFAVLVSKKYWGRWITIFATIAMLVVFSIPHSKGGSELNRITGKIESSTDIQ